MAVRKRKRVKWKDPWEKAYTPVERKRLHKARAHSDEIRSQFERVLDSKPDLERYKRASLKAGKANTAVAVLLDTTRAHAAKRLAKKARAAKNLKAARKLEEYSKYRFMRAEALNRSKLYGRRRAAHARSR